MKVRVRCRECGSLLDWKWAGTPYEDAFLIEACPCQLIKCSRCKNILPVKTKERYYCPKCVEEIIDMTYKEAYKKGKEEV